MSSVACCPMKACDCVSIRFARPLPLEQRYFPDGENNVNSIAPVWSARLKGDMSARVQTWSDDMTIRRPTTEVIVWLLV